MSSLSLFDSLIKIFYDSQYDQNKLVIIEKGCVFLLRKINNNKKLEKHS